MFYVGFFFCVVLPLNSTQQQENYSYGRPAAVTTYDNKQYYQTTIASAQRPVTENYYQTGEPLNVCFILGFMGFDLIDR